MADLTYQTSRVEHSQAGDLLYGGNVATNNIKGLPYTITISPASSTSNVCLATITVKDETGSAIAFPTEITVWLSDASSGAGLTATTASGAVAAGASGADLGTLTSKKALKSQTNASGVYILSITDTAKTGFYVCAQAGRLAPTVSAQLTSGSYG